MGHISDKKKGAVTVFFIIIMMACFMFGGFFIDASRILVAKRHVKNALNSAARSTLSYYDESLIAEYGLFGFDGEKAEGNLKRYFADNLNKSRDEGMQLFKYEIEEIAVTPLQPLEGEELRRQIVEYEKYRGPVNITIGVIEKFKHIFDKVGDAGDKLERADNTIKDMKKDFKDNHGTFKDATKSLKDTIKKDIKNSVKKKIEEVSTEWVTNTLPAELNDKYEEAKRKIKAAEDDLNELYKVRDKYVNEAKELCEGGNQENTSEEASEYINQDKTLQQQADEQIQKLSEAIASAKKIIKDVETDIEATRNDLVPIVSLYEQTKTKLEPAQTAYDMAKQGRESAEREKNNAQNAANSFNSTINSAQGTISANNKKIEDLKKDNDNISDDLKKNNYDVYSNADWKEYCRLIDGGNQSAEAKQRTTDLENAYKNGGDNEKKQYKMMTNYKSIASYNKSNSNLQYNLNNAQSQKSAAQSRLNSANNAYNTAKANEDSKKAELDKIKDDIERLKNSIIDKQSTMERIAENLNSIPDMKVEELKIPKLKNSISRMADDIGEYSDLVKKIKKGFEQLTATMSSVRSANGDKVIDSEETNLLTLLSSIKDNIKSMIRIVTKPEELRNEMYYIDYVMDKCTFLTSQTSRSHYFNKGEVEYIIFGWDSQLANITSAIAAIYGIRFIIDGVDYFLTDATPELFSRIAIAVGKGAVRAAWDMYDMLLAKGDEAPGCPLCPSLDNLNLKLSYSDHLRFFLLLNSGTSKDALKNTMSTTLVNEKHTKDMNRLYTQVKADVKVKINLLILPMIGSDLLPNEYFTDGSYVIHESIVEGYE